MSKTLNSRSITVEELSAVDCDWDAAAVIFCQRFLEATDEEEAIEALRSGLIAEAMAELRLGLVPVTHIEASTN